MMHADKSSFLPFLLSPIVVCSEVVERLSIMLFYFEI